MAEIHNRGDFLPRPYPERFGVFGDDPADVPIIRMTIGLARITKDWRGLKIHPVVVPAIKIGGVMVDISAAQARIVARRLNEFADAADAQARTATDAA